MEMCLEILLLTKYFLTFLEQEILLIEWNILKINDDQT